MGFLNRLFRGFTGGVLNPDSWIYQLFGGTTTESSESVSSTTAPQVAAVYACITLISDTIASIPLNVYKVNGKDQEIWRQHPLDHLLSKRPNIKYGAYDFKRAMISTMLLHGNAYILPMRTGGRISALELLDPSAVTLNYESGKLIYTVTLAGGQSLELSPDQILHLKAWTVDGYQGLSPITYAREVIGSAMSATKHIGRYFGKGTVPSGILEYPNIANDPEKLTSAGMLFANQVKKGATPVLPQGAKYTPLQSSNKDAALIESLRWSVEEICRIFRVPPHKVGMLEHGVYNNSIEAQNAQFVMDCIRPLVEMIEEELENKLLNSGGYAVEFNLMDLQRGDIMSQVQMDVSHWNIGAKSVNEIRRAWGLPPIPGGDEYFSPMHMSNQSDINNGKKETDKTGGASERV